MVTQDHIESAVQQLGLSGLPVCIHASLRSFGCVEGGAETVLAGVLSQGCTVLVTTFSDDFAIPPPPNSRPKRNGWDYESYPGRREGVGRVYSPLTNEITVEEMGVVPATVLAQPDRVRGPHPLCSFTALGVQAQNLIQGQTLIDVFAPLRALGEAGGWNLLMGVGLHRLTLIHAAEEAAGRQLFIRWANGPDGNPAGVTVGGCSDGFDRLGPDLAPLARRCQVGSSVWHAYPAGEALQTVAAAITRDPAITHCNNSTCERCRDAIQGGPLH